MFQDLTIRVKNIAADMGSGFVVIAGFLLAITMVFVMVFARWNGVCKTTFDSNYEDKPRMESAVDDSGCVTVALPENY
jgi:hypothetical protein